MTQAEKKLILRRLDNFKKNYNFTNKKLAQELETTEAAISHWFSGDSLPRKDKIETIYHFFKKNCVPGIIKIPTNKHWTSAYFLLVKDIKDPYLSYVNDGTSGEEPNIFAKWIADWKKTFPNPEICYVFSPETNLQSMLYKVQNLNTLVEFRNCFIGQPDIASAFKEHPGLCPSSFDFKWAQKLIDGEWDGN